MQKEKLIKIAAIMSFMIAGFCFVLGQETKEETSYEIVSEGASVVSSQADTAGSLESSETSEVTSSAIETSDGLVNINTADESELKTLPGIGSARAKSIIEYRNKNGTFARKEDIMKVSGIKEASYEKLKDLIKVE